MLLVKGGPRNRMVYVRMAVSGVALQEKGKCLSQNWISFQTSNLGLFQNTRLLLPASVGSMKQRDVIRSNFIKTQWIGEGMAVYVG